MNKMKPLKVSQYSSVENKKKTLIISPHADDEILGCYGYIDNEIQKGNIVDIIIMGVSNLPTYGGNEINIQQKIDEIEKCHKTIGVRKSIILSDMESRLNEIPEYQIVGFFDEVLKEGYDTVFIPYKSRHVDHVTTHNTAMASLRLKGRYLSSKRSLFIRISFHRKFR